MRLRLFWKILIVSWLASVLASTILFRVVFNARQINDSQLAAERLRSAEVALRYGGPVLLDQLTANWPPNERARLKLVAGSDGKIHPILEPLRDIEFLHFVATSIQFSSALLLSAGLAAYLSRPIAQLRTGFLRISQGDLSTRLGRSIGGWHDEIADLAYEFDAMAVRLQQLVASRDRLLHDVSHELRSPMARLSLAVALARQNGELSDLAFARIEAESVRLNVIVGDLLSLARAESNAAAEEIYFELAGFLQMICDDARFEAQPRQVSVELKLSPELSESAQTPLMKGPPELLRRAVENVIRNALRFSPPGKTVQVYAGVADGKVVIEVRDEGPGVPPGMLESIFDPFVKGPNETHGIGLGLAIARRAITAFKGELQAFNLQDGGLLMRLTVPISADLVS